MDLHPRLIVTDSDAAISWYGQVFGAELVERFADPTRGGQVVHAQVRIGGSTLALADEDLEWGNVSPTSAGAATAIVQLDCEDVDAVWARALEAGAEVVFPLADQFYGKREGRLRDPFGHLWITSQTVEELTPEEIERRMGSLST